MLQRKKTWKAGESRNQRGAKLKPTADTFEVKKGPLLILSGLTSSTKT